MRILALDVGERRIGLAVADDRHRVALPLATLQAEGDPYAAVADVAREQGAEKVIVGLPISLNGSLGPQGQRVRAFAETLASRSGLSVETWDERLTSVEARRRLSRGRPTDKGAVDALAAAIILQAYLDSLPPDSVE